MLSSPRYQKKPRSWAWLFLVSDFIVRYPCSISFIVSLGILLVFTAAAAVLVMLDKIFAIIAVAVFAVGIILAIIALFLIYAIGHIISQNNEIIKKL